MPSPHLIAFAAPSGTGKTTLICRLVEALRERGLRVGTLKSDAHRVELDTPGKDTHRMRKSGSETTAIVSRDQIAVFRDAPGPAIPVEAVVELFFGGLDLVLAEGFRERDLPTIVVRREAVSSDGWRPPRRVIATVSDAGEDGALDPQGPPGFALDDIAGIADFICAHRAAAGD